MQIQQLLLLSSLAIIPSLARPIDPPATAVFSPVPTAVGPISSPPDNTTTTYLPANGTVSDDGDDDKIIPIPLPVPGISTSSNHGEGTVPDGDAEGSSHGSDLDSDGSSVHEPLTDGDHLPTIPEEDEPEDSPPEGHDAELSSGEDTNSGVDSDESSDGSSEPFSDVPSDGFDEDSSDSSSTDEPVTEDGRLPTIPEEDETEEAVPEDHVAEPSPGEDTYPEDDSSYASSDGPSDDFSDGPSDGFDEESSYGSSVDEPTDDGRLPTIPEENEGEIPGPVPDDDFPEPVSVEPPVAPPVEAAALRPVFTNAAGETLVPIASDVEAAKILEDASKTFTASKHLPFNIVDIEGNVLKKVWRDTRDLTLTPNKVAEAGGKYIPAPSSAAAPVGAPAPFPAPPSTPGIPSMPNIPGSDGGDGNNDEHHESHENSDKSHHDSDDHETTEEHQPTTTHQSTAMQTTTSTSPITSATPPPAPTDAADGSSSGGATVDCFGDADQLKAMSNEQRATCDQQIKQQSGQDLSFWADGVAPWCSLSPDGKIEVPGGFKDECQEGVRSLTEDERRSWVLGSLPSECAEGDQDKKTAKNCAKVQGRLNKIAGL